jgi:hypothetical protein
MTTDNQQGTAPEPGRDEPGVENTEESTKQAPGYNELERETGNTGGDVDQQEPTWRPGDDPAGRPSNAGMQGEGEPGRAERDSTGGVEGTGGGEEP